MLLVTDSLIRKASVDVDQHLNIADPTITLIPEQLGPDGHNYLKFGLPTSVLAVPLYALAWLLPVGAVQTAFLLNPLLTALTALLIMGTVTRLGYNHGVAALTALAFGLGSMALVYAKYFGSEPLVGLSLALAVWALAGLWRTPAHSIRYAAWAGFALGLGVVTRPATAVVLPVMGLWFLWALAQSGPLKTQLRPLAAFALPGLVWLGIMLGYNALRFGSPFDTGYGVNETFSTPFLTGFYGQLFSPGKSLFVYSPVLVLGVGGGWLLWHKRDSRPFVVLLGLSALAYLGLYSMWFGWWGGVYWGPRHTAPIIVLLIPLIAPLIDAARSHRPARWIAGTLSALSIVPQMLGGLMHFAPWEIQLNQLAQGATQAMIFIPRFSPLWYHLTNFRIDDVAWITGSDGPALWLPLLGLIILAALLWLLVQALGNPTPLGKPTPPRWPLRGAMVAVVALWGLTLWHANRSPPYGPLAGPRAALAKIDADYRPGDVLLSRTGERTTLIMNDMRARLPWYTFDARPELPGDDVAFHLERVAAGAQRIWLLTPETRDLSNPTALFIESWLSDRAFPISDETLGPSARLVRYDLPRDHHWIATTTQWGAEFMLEQLWFGITGEYIKVALQWQALRVPSTNYSVSVQLLAADGQLAGQIDRWPVNGTRPTAAWQPGESVIDRYALPVEGLAAGDYTLWLVLYDGATLERLPVQAAGDSATSDSFFVGAVTLGP